MQNLPNCNSLSTLSNHLWGSSKGLRGLERKKDLDNSKNGSFDISILNTNLIGLANKHLHEEISLIEAPVHISFKKSMNDTPKQFHVVLVERM